MVASLAALVVVFLMLLGSSGFGAAPAAAQIRQTPTPVGQECGRTLANISALLVREYGFESVSLPGPAFCDALENEVNAFIEAHMRVADSVQIGAPGESRGAFAFIDFGARQYVGTIPDGDTFTAVARNALPGSTMVFVVADEFAVFVDVMFTTINEDNFLDLPDYRQWEGDIRPFCGAEWCLVPGQRPTPGG